LGSTRDGNVLHAVAKFQLKSENTNILVNTILDEDCMKVITYHGNIQSISNTAWACATLGVDCPSLFKAINEKAPFLAENGNSQAIANTALACATLGVKCPSLFKAINVNASFLAENGKPQDISNTAWACATLGVECPSLFKAINKKASFLVENGSPQAIANTAWACATLVVECPSLFKAINEKAPFLAENGNSQDIANTAWACATLGVECPSLFKAINEKASFLVENGSPQDIANTAWAISHFGWQSNAFFRVISSNMDSIVTSGDVQCIANLCYAFAIMGCASKYEIEFRCLWSHAIEIKIEDLNNEACWQLLQAFFMVSQTMSMAQPKTLLLKSDRFLKGTETVSSRTQQEMSDLLTKLGFVHEIEVSPFPDLSGFLAIDVACKDRMIAIEFDGPSHFLREINEDQPQRRKENGPTRAKRRLLERLGWSVINVCYWEWQEAGTKERKEQLLAKKFSLCGMNVT